MQRISTLIAAVFCGTIAAADAATQVETAFAGWVSEVGAQNAVLSLWKDGAWVRDVEIGVETGQTPVEMASLSKAITAVCAISMIQDGTWTDETSSAEVLGMGPEGLTVSRLMTHALGVSPDLTQSLMPISLGSNESTTDRVAELTLQQAEEAGTSAEFAYHNGNYAILGAMIVAQTGASYRETCGPRVFEAAGLAVPERSSWSEAFLPWGGWRMSVQDYAAFLNWAFGPEGPVGQDVRNAPMFELAENLSYGAGMFQRAAGERFNHWHFGALCFPGRLTVGSYAVRWANGWSVVAAYDACVDFEQMGALDGAMIGAVFQ